MGWRRWRADLEAVDEDEAATQGGEGEDLLDDELGLEQRLDHLDPQRFDARERIDQQPASTVGGWAGGWVGWAGRAFGRAFGPGESCSVGW